MEAFEGVFKSDTIVPQDLRVALIRAVAKLENIPAREKDWHPRSNLQVLDLVHPSLYPLVFGQSKILLNETIGLHDCFKRCGDGIALPTPLMTEFLDNGCDNAWSCRFQWLPTEYQIPFGCDDVKQVRLVLERPPELTHPSRTLSYINNLHPMKHKELYSVIEQVVAKAIPLWNQTLTRVNAPCSLPPRVQLDGDGFEDGNEIGSIEQGDNETDSDYWGRVDDIKSLRKVIHPEPEEFQPPIIRLQNLGDQKYQNGPVINLRKDYGRVQIIVKLANIHLTPENPRYNGGTWHVEGQLNERM